MDNLQFKTIRQTAAAGILPEHRLRAMRAAGTLPGFYSASRFYVNVNALQEQLQASTSAGGGERGAEYLRL